MTKKELIEIVAEGTDLPKTKAAEAVNTLITAIENALLAGDDVVLAGFGTFKVKERAERKGVNPQTKESVVIPATKVPTFKPGKALKEKIAQ
ncbi:MAG: HU family DNA-binding protein [Clostridia bacterium]|nr:HU family DNA-binding protein [Clostridia bacterium]